MLEATAIVAAHVVHAATIIIAAAPTTVIAPGTVVGLALLAVVAAVHLVIASIVAVLGQGLERVQEGVREADGELLLVDRAFTESVDGTFNGSGGLR